MGQHQFQSLIIQKAPDKKEYADDDDGHADDGDDDREQDMVGRSWERHIFFQNIFTAYFYVYALLVQRGFYWTLKKLELVQMIDKY